MSASRSLVAPEPVGRTAIAPLAQKAKFSDPIGRHHRPFYDDYDVAKMHILQALGDLSDLDIFGRQVACAVFIRPNTMPITMPDGTKSVLYLPIKEVKEDFYQNKTVLVLKCGPEAFTGEENYLTAMYGGFVPAPGEWLFANANSGIQVNLVGDGASRPQSVDRRGEPLDIFEWDGWPCRIMSDDNFLGRIAKPHQIV